jgi:HD-GYP domain-containing protein (c-di-GMP phosphodiesterase class II)
MAGAAPHTIPAAFVSFPRVPGAGTGVKTMSSIAKDLHSQESMPIDAAKISSTAARKETGTNKELWLLLSLFLIAFILNFLVDSQRMVLGFYVLPTLFSAYRYGRRHAVLTALASILLVVLLVYFQPPVMHHQRVFVNGEEKWFDIALWGGIMLVIAYAMGTLYEHMKTNMRELRESYQGILLIMQHIASNDKYSRNHAYRVSICATKIAERMEIGSEQVEDVRAAALLHDIDKLGISHEILYKSANFTEDEFRNFQRDMAKGKAALPPVGGSLRRVLPILLAHTENEGKVTLSPDAPIETRILAVADAYETLTGGSTGMAPSVAIESIAKRAGAEFDPKVVEAFVSVFQQGRAQPVSTKG